MKNDTHTLKLSRVQNSNHSVELKYFMTIFFAKKFAFLHSSYKVFSCKSIRLETCHVNVLSKSNALHLMNVLQFTVKHFPGHLQPHFQFFAPMIRQFAFPGCQCYVRRLSQTRQKRKKRIVAMLTT